MPKSFDISLIHRLSVFTHHPPKNAHLRKKASFYQSNHYILIKKLKDLKDYSTLYWVWHGAYHRGTPVLRNTSIIRYLYRELILPIPPHFRLTLRDNTDENNWNVNPYRYITRNGYNPDLNDFKVASSDIQDLVDMIPLLDKKNMLTLKQLEVATHRMYTIPELELALKLLNRSIKL